MTWGDLREVLPEKISSVLHNAIPELGKKLRGFDAPDALLTGPETRSSSPVRILRDETLQSSPARSLSLRGGSRLCRGDRLRRGGRLRCAEAVLRDLQKE